MRRVNEGDADAYHEVFSDPEVCLYDDFSPCSEADAKTSVADIAARYESDNPLFEFAVALRDGGELVGFVCYIMNERVPYLGFHLARRFQGKGLGAESARALIGYLDSIGHRYLGAVVDPANFRSIGLLEKLGFRHQRDQVVSSNGEEKTEHVMIRE